MKFGEEGLPLDKQFQTCYNVAIKKVGLKPLKINIISGSPNIGAERDAYA